MILPLQSLVKYDNAVLVSSTKEKKSKEKLLKVLILTLPPAQSTVEYTTASSAICSQEACYLVSTRPKYLRQRTS